MARATLALGLLAMVGCGETIDDPCALESINARLARGEHVTVAGCDLVGTVVVGRGAFLEATETRVTSEDTPALRIEGGTVSGLSLRASGPVPVVLVTRPFEPVSVSELDIDARDAAAGLALVSVSHVAVSDVRIQGGTYGLVASRVGDVSEFPDEPGAPGAAPLSRVQVEEADVGVWIEIGHVELGDLAVTGSGTAGVVLDMATVALVSGAEIDGGEVGLFGRDIRGLAIEGGTIGAALVDVQLEGGPARLTGTHVSGGEVGVRALGSQLLVEDSTIERPTEIGIHASRGSLRVERSTISGAGSSTTGAGDGIQVIADATPRLEDVQLLESGRVGLLWQLPTATPSRVGTASVEGDSLGAIAQSADAVFPQGEWSAEIVRPDAMRDRDAALSAPLATSEPLAFELEPLDLRELGFDAP